MQSISTRSQRGAPGTRAPLRRRRRVRLRVEVGQERRDDRLIDRIVLGYQHPAGVSYRRRRGRAVGRRQRDSARRRRAVTRRCREPNPEAKIRADADLALELDSPPMRRASCRLTASRTGPPCRRLGPSSSSVRNRSCAAPPEESPRRCPAPRRPGSLCALPVRAANHERHLGVIGERHRVVQQVEEDLASGPGGPADKQQKLLDPAGDHEAFGARPRSDHRDGLFGDLARVESDARQLQTAGLDARQVQESSISSRRAWAELCNSRRAAAAQRRGPSGAGGRPCRACRAPECGSRDW